MRLVYGVGTNEGKIPVTWMVEGKKVVSPYYMTWQGMLKRCYYPKYHTLQPTYIGCSVCEGWLTFSTFQAWMTEQDWQNKQLDKDLLLPGNKLYSPDTCCFIEGKLNNFILAREASRGDWPIGVHYRESKHKYQADCRDPLTGKQEYLGLFASPEEAHEAWRAKKHSHALAYAALESDPRIVKALETRYAPQA